MRAWTVHATHVLDGEGAFGPANVTVRDGLISAVERGAPRAGARALPDGAILSPGFCDLQVNGGAGILVNDVRDGEDLVRIAHAHRAGGTTTLLPTVITDAAGAIERAAEAVEAARRLEGSEAIAGLHIEGPFISPHRPGVHPRQHIRRLNGSDADALAGLGARRSALGAVLLTLAPEEIEPGVIARLTAAGLTVVAGHTEASTATLARARSEGLGGYTHLFNAMPPLAGRAPGPVGACLDDDEAWCGMIADGIHVDPVNLRLVFRRKPPGRVVLVTDAMPVAGTAYRRFALAGRVVHRRDGALRTEDGTLAGADLTMIEAVRNAVTLGGVSPAAALLMATAAPADAVGLPDRGRIAPGLRADLNLLDYGRRRLRAPEVAYDLPAGCIGTYYPEANVLLPTGHYAKGSKTPAAKSIPVRVFKEEDTASEPGLIAAE